MNHSRIKTFIFGVAVIGTSSLLVARFSSDEPDSSHDTDDFQEEATPQLGREVFSPIPAPSLVASDNGVQLTVRYPDGTGIDYQLRPHPTVPELPDGRIKDYYDKLVEQANGGDEQAAYELHKALSYCEVGFSSVDSLESALHDYQETGVMRVPTGEGLATVSTSFDMHTLESQFREQLNKCEGLTVDQISAENDWLVLAAENGSPTAQFDLGQLLLTSGDPTAAEYLKRAWESGNLGAASHLWYFYTRNRNPKLYDPIQGYAYGYLSRQIRQGFLDLQNPSEQNARDRINNEWKMMAEGNELGPVDMQTAIELSKELMPRSEVCCYAPEFM